MTIPEAGSINGSIEIAAEAIEQLWRFGSPTPRAIKEHESIGYFRTMRSEDGKWHLKLDPIGPHLTEATRHLNASELCDIHSKELSRLRRLGLQVITFGRVPFIDEHKVMMITPWLDDINDAPVTTYDAQVKPIVDTYYRQWLSEHDKTPTSRPLHALDLNEEQFSVTNSIARAFLHDVDPALGYHPDSIKRRFWPPFEA